MKSSLPDQRTAPRGNTKSASARDARRWAAVLERDTSHETDFVYGVATTGVYCRCSCPSRRPLRANVTFFKTPQEASDAGFRPCRRCTPDTDSPAERNTQLITRACRIIEAARETPKLGELAGELGLSPYHFHRLFKSIAGVTPKDYWLAHCRGKVRDALPKAESVTQAVFGAGFASARQFYATSNAVLGMRPAAYRAGGGAATIRFATGACSLGAILVASTDKGICAILLGDSAEDLLRDLQKRFAHADLIGDDPDFQKIAARVIAFADRSKTRFDLPLDVAGTAFQHRVWQALRDIPYGSTASYSDIAQQIGQPAAVRAVARACGANPAAIAIPCHRVVRNDGALSGYRWGIERKRALLERESTAASSTRREKSKKGTAP